METPQGSPMAAIDTPSHQQATEQTVQSSQAREDGSVSALGAGQVAVSDGGHDVQQKDCNSSKTITAERSDEPNRTDLYNGSPTPALAAGVEVGEPQSAHWVSTEEATSVDWRREPLELQGLDTSWRSSLVIQHRGQGPGRRGDGEDSPYLSLSLSSNSSHQENVTVGVGSYQSEASCSLTLSQQQAIGYHTLSTSSPLTSVRDPHSGNPLGWAGEGSEGGGAYEPIAESPNEPDSQPKPGSPFLVVQKSDVNDMSKFESPGLLYARASKREHDRDLYQPADEIAEDVLETYKDNIHEEAVSPTPVVLDKAGGEAGGRGMEEAVEIEGERRGGTEEEQRSHDRGEIPGAGVEQEAVVPRRTSLSHQYGHRPPPIDPGVLLHLERDAQKLASSLAYTMDNLRNSLHAMTVCSQQSVQLHRESAENLHRTVDANVKAMYTFMAKFEELNKHVGPMLEIAAQIRELNETLRMLERQFRIP